MKREADYTYQTPVKKWIHLSPFQEQNLAIIESDDSADQPELFSALVGHTHDRLTHSPHSPLSHQHPDSQEEEEEDDEEDIDAESFSSAPHSPPSLPHSSQPKKEQEQRTTDRVTLRAVDQNRKGCNCRNSKCDKNYCDCLRSGQACGEGICSCVDCLNTEEHQEKRETNRKLLEEEPVGPKGCRCRKSKCQKKYCECHSAGRKCSEACFCIECNNQPEDRQDGYESMRRLRKGEVAGRVFLFR